MFLMELTPLQKYITMLGENIATVAVAFCIAYTAISLTHMWYKHKTKAD